MSILVKNIGLIALAIGIIIAAYITAMSHRYQSVYVPGEYMGTLYTFDRWTGTRR